jgi:hypothetical protein
MKIKAAKDEVMVRLIVNGMPMFITNVPVEVDENNPEVMEQVETMVKLGWLEVVREVKEAVEEGEVKVKSKRGSSKVEIGE